jgi:hypothetical protein
MSICSNKALHRLSLTRVQAITYCDLGDKRRWNRADKRDQSLRRPAGCSQLVSISVWSVRFRFLSWLGASGPRLMIDRDSYKRLLDGVQHARKRKHRLRFFTVQQQESNRLKTECRTWMAGTNGWLWLYDPIRSPVVLSQTMDHTNKVITVKWSMLHDE